jgi:23S rRNA pseudouridine2605 synthase
MRPAKADAHKAEGPEPRPMERIAKVMARAGACSRRDAELWIEQGRVAVNGEVLRSPALDVGEDDAITIDGTILPRRARTRLFRFHKPRGLVTTEHDPEGRQTIFDHLREHWRDGPRVVSVGRLDINTEGLMLLTNDGGLARVLELPATGWVRRYRVRVNGETDQATLDTLRRGITIDGISYAGIEATLDRVQGANSWLTMALREGKNREIKRVLEHLGLQVNRLIRISFGPFQLGELADGAVEEVRTKVLRDQLGPSLAEAASVDFSSPSGDEPEPAPRSDEAPRPRSGPRTEAGQQRDRRASEGNERVPAYRRPERGGAMRQEPNCERMRESGGGGFAPRPRPARAEAGARQDTPVAPKRKPPPRVRKHVSVLRREEAATQDGPRKRIERGETADRKGRVVPVERVVSAKPTEAPPQTRNGRRFEALRKGSADGAARERRYDPVEPSRSKRDARDSRAQQSGPRNPEKRAGRSGAPEAYGGARQEAPRRGRAGDRPAHESPAARGSRGADGSRAAFGAERSEPTWKRPDARPKSGERPARQGSQTRGFDRAENPGRKRHVEPGSDFRGSDRARERPKGTSGARASTDKRNGDARRETGAKSKPPGRRPPGGGSGRDRDRPGRPPRKT